MTNREDRFQNNLRALELKYPELAKTIRETRVPTERYSAVLSRKGPPVMTAEGITFHSVYDPVKEGRDFIRKQKEMHPVPPGERVAVFGLGFGYHIAPLIEESMDAVVIEPRPETLRFAMEWVDLTEIIEKTDLVVGDDLVGLRGKTACIWAHQPSVNYNRGFYNRLITETESVTDRGDARTPTIVKEKLKIMVITPVYGGSLPVARSCYEGLKGLGHDVELWDASMFSVPFQKSLEITTDARNRKVIHDRFMALISDMILASCAEFRPDLVLALAQAPLSIETIQSLKENRIVTAFWFVEDYQVLEYWKAWAPHYDFFFTIQKDGNFLGELERLGVKHYAYLPMAADPETHKPMDLSPGEVREFGSDLSFMGAGYYNRHQFFKGILDFDFKIWGTGWDPNSPLWKRVQRNGERIPVEDFVKIFNASKINLNLHSSVFHEGVNPQGDFVNPRTFEIAACGAFQLVDYRSELPAVFAPDEEIVCFHNLEDLRDQIRYYLDRPEERRRIAERARSRVLKEHTYQARMETMLSFIRARRPEAFAHRATPGTVTLNLADFCRRFPETQSLLAQAGGSGPMDLDGIVDAIQSDRGALKTHEAIFLLMKEFREKISGMRN